MKSAPIVSVFAGFAAFCLLMYSRPVLARTQTSTIANSGTSEQRPSETKTKRSKKKKNTEAEQSYTFQPIVVTATRTKTPLSQVTKTIHVITGKELKTRQQTSVPEALNTVPGVMVQNQGGPGQYSTINIRGVGSEYVQFQYNGFPLRDTADAQTTFNFFEGNLYGQAGINRIEVLNGTNSVLYGSSAMGGVVNIIPHTWQYGFSGGLMSEAGPHDTFIENGGFAYGKDNYYINFYPTYITTNGISNGGPNSYWYHNFGFTGGAGIRFGDNMTLQICDMSSRSDSALSAVLPSLNAQHQLIVNQASATDHVEGGFDLTGVTFTQDVSPMWDYSIQYAYGSTERRYIEPQEYFGVAAPSRYEGTTNYLEMQHNFHPARWLTLTGGFDYDGASYSNVEPTIQNFQWNGSFQTASKNWFGYDLFGQAQLALFNKSLFLTGGLRFHDHQDFPSRVVEGVSAAYIFKKTGTKIHSAFGTGYRTPSLYEIYGGYINPVNGQTVTIGNPNLTPEKSTSYEAGVTQPLLGNKLNIGITWFYMDFNNLIIFNGFTNEYENVDRGRSEGIEAKIQANPCKYFSLTASYTYAHSQFTPNNTNQWARAWYWPMNTFAVVGTVRPVRRLSISVKLLWEGDRIIPLYDSSYNEILWKEPGDTRVDMSATYRIAENCRQVKSIDLFLKITNLFDENYTESGFQMPGQWIYGGTRITF